MMQSLTESHFAIGLDDIRAAAARIEPFVLRTPSIFCERLSVPLGCRVHLKAESLQHIGAFKARGATNAVMLLTDEIATRGVVTHSSGNHAAAVARAATLRKIPAFVVMPSNSAKNKIVAVRSYGVEPVFCEPTAQSRFETAERLRKETEATLVHPYDYAPVMAGQGTVGLELLEQIPALDAVIVPVGGGGLLSGVLMAIKSLRPEVKIIAAEPEWADDAARSLKSGRIEMPSRYDSIADGLRTPLGELPFSIIRELLDDILLVSEDAIRTAMRSLAETAHLVVEPSGAVAFAALSTSAERFKGQNVAVVISGGNLDFGNCGLDDFQKTCHQLNRPLLVISGSKGCLTCGYLSMDSFERNGDAAAIVRGVDTYEDMLAATVKEVSSLGRELGVEPGMTGQQALEIFR